MSFGFAKIWERDKATMEELQVPSETATDTQVQDTDFWAQVMERHRLDEEAKARTVTSGRGVRRKATKTVSTDFFLLDYILTNIVDLYGEREVSRRGRG